MNKFPEKQRNKSEKPKSEGERGKGACRPCTGKIKEPPSVGEDNNGDIGLAENRKFMGLLEQARAPLRESNLPAIRILDLLYLDFAPTHLISPKTHHKSAIENPKQATLVRF